MILYNKMKSVVFGAVLLLLNIWIMPVAAQDKDSVLNILKAPFSPAASILGVSPSDVQRPTDPSAFMLTLQNATSNFSALPSSYAVDIAPAWLFGGHKITYRDFVDSQDVWKSIKQSFVLSAAFTSKSDSTGRDASLGFGVKISLLRGAINSGALAAVSSSQNVLNSIAAAEGAAITALVVSPAYNNATAAMQSIMIDTARNATRARLQNLSDSLKEIAKAIDFVRHGWKLDLAGGASVSFPNQQFNYGTINKAGAWLTGGYEGKGGFSTLFILRYLYNPDKVFADDKMLMHKDNVNTFDGGLRFLYDNHDKFTISGEAIYRSMTQKTGVQSADELVSTYRFTINADYKIAANRLLTLAVGRDYDGTFRNDGNLIAALNLLLGFGNNRGRP